MAEAGTSSRVRTIVLVLSVCLNALLIGLLVVFLTRAATVAVRQPGGQVAPGAIIQGLSPESQAKVREVMQLHAEALRQARQATNRTRLIAFRTFAAVNFNSDAFNQALEDVRAADARFEEEQILQLKDVIDELTPDERRTVVTRIRTGANRPWYRRWFTRTPAVQ